MGGKIALLGNFIVRSCSLAPAGVRRILLIFGPEHNRGAANNRANFSKFHLRFGQKEKKRKESGILVMSSRTVYSPLLSYGWDVIAR